MADVPPTIRHNLFLSPYGPLETDDCSTGVVPDPSPTSMTITGSGRVTRPPKVLYSGTDPVPAKKRRPKKKKIVVVKKSGPGAKVFAAPVITPLKSSYDTSPMEDDVVSINDVSLGGGGEGEGATTPTREHNDPSRDSKLLLPRRRSKSPPPLLLSDFQKVPQPPFHKMSDKHPRS